MQFEEFAHREAFLQEPEIAGLTQSASRYAAMSGAGPQAPAPIPAQVACSLYRSTLQPVAIFSSVSSGEVDLIRTVSGKYGATEIHSTTYEVL